MKRDNKRENRNFRFSLFVFLLIKIFSFIYMFTFSFRRKRRSEPKKKTLCIRLLWIEIPPFIRLAPSYTEIAFFKRQFQRMSYLRLWQKALAFCLQVMRAEISILAGTDSPEIRIIGDCPASIFFMPVCFSTYERIKKQSFSLNE